MKRINLTDPSVLWKELKHFLALEKTRLAWDSLCKRPACAAPRLNAAKYVPTVLNSTPSVGGSGKPFVSLFGTGLLTQTKMPNKYYGGGVAQQTIGNTFLHNWQKLLTSVTDADPKFIHSAGLFLLSTFSIWFHILVLSNVSFKSDSGDIGKELALWWFLFGKTRITRKSTVTGKVEDIIEELLKSILLSHEFTPESIISEASLLSTQSGGRTHMAWVNDEVLPTFERMKKAGSYMVGLDSVLSRIYDGRDYTRRTLKRGNERVRHPYLTIFACSTESLPQSFDEASFRQGLLNRPIFQHIQKASGRSEENRDLNNDEKKLLAECKDYLKAMIESDAKVLAIDSDSKKMIDDFDKEINGMIESADLGIKEGYIGNLPNLLQRLSGLYCINRHTKQQIATPRIMVILKEDVEDALNYINDVVLDGLDAVIKQMNMQSIKPRDILTDGRLYDIAKSCLKGSFVDAKNQTYENAMTEKELFAKLNIDWYRFVHLIQDMIKRDEIMKHESIEMKTPGRRPDIIQLKL